MTPSPPAAGAKDTAPKAPLGAKEPSAKAPSGAREAVAAKEPAARVPAAPATVPPGRPAASEPRKASNDEPEAVSLRDIETLLTPGKVPPRLPATSARAIGAGRGAPPLAKPLPRPAAEPPRPAFESQPDGDAVPASSRAGDAHSADLAAMAALVPPRPAAQRSVRPPPRPIEGPPPSTVERTLPNPLEASAADLELMAALAAVPAKKPDASKPAWAPPAAPVQAKAKAVAVVSSAAAAALKGTKPAGGATPAAAPWRIGSGGSLGSPLRPAAPKPPVAPSERPPAGDRPSVIVPPPPPPPVRVGPPRRKTITDAADLDDAWGAPEDEPQDSPHEPDEESAAPPADEPALARSAELTAEETASANLRAASSLAMRANPRASLPDPAELLRDAPEGRKDAELPKPKMRGSVVDPLELYGAAAAPPKPEHTLPKVMVQLPARSPEPKPPAPKAPPDAKAAPDAKLAAEAEAKTAAAAAEASHAFKPKVDLPARAEPRPFPKPPPRRAATPSPEAVASKTEARPDAPTHEKKPSAEAKPAPHEAKPAAPEPRPAAPSKPQVSAAALKKLDPKAIWDVGPLPDEPLGDDEIPIDVTPDAPDSADAAGAPPSAEPTSDSGRFDLQQLMSTGPRSAKKGVADTDLFSLAGDLFTDTSPQKLAPPDLSRLPKRGASVPPPPDRLLAPVAATTRPPVVAEIAAVQTAPVTERGVRAGAGGGRRFNPWLLLPVVALAAAAIMVLLGRSTETTSGQPTATATAPQPALTAPQPARTAVVDAPAPATAQVADTTGDKPSPTATAKPEPGQTSSAAAWKPPQGGTGASAPATTGAPPATTGAGAPTTTKTAPAPTATASAPPAGGGGEFNSAAAKAALRNAAGAAAGCPSDKPGMATVSITFAPSGRVTSSVVSGGFAGTTTGGCIASAMRSATVPPFDGGPVSVVWKVTLR
jgi:hypothetical protein